MRKLVRNLLWILVLPCGAGMALAGQQEEEKLAPMVRSSMQRAISDATAPRLVFEDETQGKLWLAEMSRRLAKRIPDQEERERLLITIQYEATRAGLDPQLVLGLIQVESAFRKYAVSHAGAQGLMQIMPFWPRYVGTPDHNLFHLRTNLRYGCTILRHYLDVERGNLFRALGRYNGSLGRAEYPNMVMSAWRQHWVYDPPPTRVVQNETARLPAAPASGVAPAASAPPSQAPAGQAPASQTPAGQTPAGQTPAVMGPKLIPAAAPAPAKPAQAAKTSS